jgi:hypothetical protein
MQKVERSPISADIAVATVRDNICAENLEVIVWTVK